MKQTAVEQLGIAFREWQIEWDNYDGKKEPKPKSFDEFIKPFLEMESQQQGYSEEDMKDYALKCVTTYLFNGDFISDNLRIPIVENNNKQFKQFKNK
jgi:hypothetical protein